MQHLFKAMLVALSCLFLCGTASASLKPGEIRLIGKLVDFDKKKKEVTFYCNKRKAEVTIAFETRKGPIILFNHKKASIRKYESKEDELYRQALVVYQPLKDYDKKNVEMKGYVARLLSGMDKEFHDELTQREPSKR
ncbi:hypothetical protein [Rubritalea marina]|uniref:hypothetical protein n=1 Tax=Rubritalea marina TaxID=361055 RepID=UPI00037CFF42|nr:hypothetical protein [Rubritalea marina]